MTAPNSVSVSTQRYACVGLTAVRLTSRRSRRSRPRGRTIATPACRRRRSPPRRHDRRGTRRRAGSGRPTGRSRTSAPSLRNCSTLSGTVASGMCTAPGTCPSSNSSGSRTSISRDPVASCSASSSTLISLIAMSQRYRLAASVTQVTRCVDVAHRGAVDGAPPRRRDCCEGDVERPFAGREDRRQLVERAVVPPSECRLEPVRRGRHRLRPIGSGCVADRSDGGRVEVREIARGDDDVATGTSSNAVITPPNGPSPGHRSSTTTVPDVGGHEPLRRSDGRECIRRRRMPSPP